jgi:inhibitor of KinA
MATSLKSAPELHYYYLSEEAITVQFGETIHPDTLRQLNSFNQQLVKQPFEGFVTTVAAYTTLTVYYDPLQVANARPIGTAGFEKVVAYLKQLAEKTIQTAKVEANKVVIPVYYGDEYGPDLIELAESHGLSVPEVIQLHSAVTYTVYMIGFVPGFAYLGGMDEKLSAPRKAKPRQHVPAGAVGIAGNQTGVYPLATPGGWQIIGQTPLKMFNADLEQPSLLKAGDEVVFEPIDRERFNHLANP